MFYADTVAGLLAHERVAEVRARGSRNESTRFHMG
jgi:hypothetical protein